MDRMKATDPIRDVDTNPSIGDQGLNPFDDPELDPLVAKPGNPASERAAPAWASISYSTYMSLRAAVAESKIAT